MSDERPWEDFADPTKVVAAPAADPGVGYTEDIAKGAAGGLGRGVAGTVGMGGTAGNLLRAGLSKAGVPDEYLDKGAAITRMVGNVVPQARLMTGPDASQVQKAIESQTGKFYEPKTVPGQYASTIAEFAPGALIPGGGGVGARVLNTVAGGLASETAGQLTKDTAAEPWARGIAGIAGGPLAAKIVTPAAPASAARQAAVATLEREGIPVSAGERTGSKPLQWLEANAADMPGSAGRAAEMKAAQATAVDRAFTERAFDPAELRARGVPPDANLPRPDVMAEGRQSLSDRYTQLSQANALRSDPALQSGLLRRQTQYERDVLPSQRTRDVEQIRNDIVDTLVAGQGSMPGGVYQHTRSRLGKAAKGSADTELATAFRGMQGDLDAAMQRGMSPQDAARWADTNRRWGNMKQLESAVASSGENLSPARVAQSVRAGRVGQAASGAGDMDELARAASLVIKPMPNSGTAARLGMQKLFNIPAWLAAGGGAGAGTLVGGPIGAAAGAVAPFVASRLAMSRPGQAYLGNQFLPQNARDVVAQAMMQQAVSQPSGVARNQDARAAYEQKRKDDLRKMGLQ